MEIQKYRIVTKIAWTKPGYQNMIDAEGKCTAPYRDDQGVKPGDDPNPYWGAPNIGEFWNKKGIITFEDENDLVNILNNLTEEDYTQRLEAIEENYILSLEKGFFFEKLEKLLDKLIQNNGL